MAATRWSTANVPWNSKSLVSAYGSGSTSRKFIPSSARGIPSYFSLADPYLIDYNQRNFGVSFGHSSVKRSSTSSLRRRSQLKSSSRSSSEVDCSYMVAVTTGDFNGAGTFASAFITLQGNKKNRSTRQQLRLNSSIEFTPGSTNVFSLSCLDLGDLKSIIIEHDGEEEIDSWFIQSILVTNSVARKSWLFPCNHWLSKQKGDGQILRQLQPIKNEKTEYEIVIETIADKEAVGEDFTSKLFIILFGDQRISPWIELKTNIFKEEQLVKNTSSSSSSSPSKTNKRKTLKFVISAAPFVGLVKKIRIQHDKRGSFPHVFIESVVITDLKRCDYKFFFDCNQWLSEVKADDGLVAREFYGTCDPRECPYEITICTGNQPDASTSASVYIQLFSKNEKSKKETLQGNFSCNSIDKVVIFCRKLRILRGILIGHDNSGVAPDWFLDKIIVTNLKTKKVYEFQCGKWFALNKDDGLIEREFLLIHQKKPKILQKKKQLDQLEIKQDEEVGEKLDETPTSPPPSISSPPPTQTSPTPASPPPPKSPVPSSSPVPPLQLSEVDDVDCEETTK